MERSNRSLTFPVVVDFQLEYAPQGAMHHSPGQGVLAAALGNMSLKNTDAL